MAKHKKTKIVCTLGPASWDKEMIKKLAQAGMNVARLNFSHGSHEEKLQQIKYIREVSAELAKPIAILADMSGPKLRLGKLEGVKEITKGDVLELSVVAQGDELPIQFDLSPFVKKGQRIFLNDGLVELVVNSINGKTIKTTAQNNGWISSNKGVNVPDTLMKNSAFTEKDHKDAEFALSNNVDYLALSFIQNAEDIEPARKLIKKHNSHTRIVVKVEKKEAVKNLVEIVRATDAIMVARGDLGIEIPAQEVPIVQQELTRLCREHQKPVIVATQMLESMTENPRPTRAEISDVANAVLDQVDAVMLSAESASGKYPVEAVTIMKDTIMSVEKNPEYKQYHKITWENVLEENMPYSAVAAAAASLAYRLNASAIVVATATGRTARLLASFRPDAQIVAVTHDQEIANQLALVWGMRSVVTKGTGSFDGFLTKAIEAVQKYSFVEKGDRIVVISGTSVGISGQTDSIKVITL